MKRLVAYCFMLGLLSLGGIDTSAQSLNAGDEFKEALVKLNAEVMPPLDGDYKVNRPLRNDTQNCQWSIRSRKEKLEIRFLTSVFSEDKPLIKFPSMAAPTPNSS